MAADTLTDDGFPRLHHRDHGAVTVDVVWADLIDWARLGGRFWWEANWATVTGRGKKTTRVHRVGIDYATRSSPFRYVGEWCCRNAAVRYYEECVLPYRTSHVRGDHADELCRGCAQPHGHHDLGELEDCWQLDLSHSSDAQLAVLGVDR